ncbi:hypothetical protein amrb99_00200 [Actinomadura sp. RB99]|nr:hypothetical protein [Actinomadura sp. RB99]
MTASNKPARRASRWYPKRADPRPAHRMPDGITILGAAILTLQILFWLYAIAS